MSDTTERRTSLLRTMSIPRRQALTLIGGCFLGLGTMYLVLQQPDQRESMVAYAFIVLLSLGLVAGLVQFLPARLLLYGVEIESDGFFYQRPLRRRKVIRYDAIERIVACAKMGPAPNFWYELKTTSGNVILHADILLETSILLKLMALPGFRFAELRHAHLPNSVPTTKKTVMWQRST